MSTSRHIVASLAVAVIVMAGLPLTTSAAKGGESADPRAAIDPALFTPHVDKAQRLHPGLDSGLNRILESPDPIEAAESLGYRVRDGLIQVIVVTDGQHMADMVAWLEDSGAGWVSSAWDLVQASVTPELLPAIEAHPWVLRVRRPIYLPDPEPTPRSPEEIASKVSAYVTEGVAAMAAGAWHSAGHTGQGIKVGVIDAQFYGYNTLAGSELPTASKLHYMAFGPATLNPGDVHGTGCAEVIYDVAPGVELYLGHAWTEVDIANAATWMKNNGCKIISMSLGWLSYGPGDGTGYLANVVNSFTSGGGVWVNSAGNSRLAHWQGQWADNDGDTYLDLNSSYMNVNYVTTDGTNLAWIPSGTTILGSLIWNQWNSPQTDLDFFTVYWDGVNSAQFVTIDGASSEDEQSGLSSQRPNEEIGFTAEVDGYYGYLVKRYSGPTNVELEYFNRFDTAPLDFNVQQGSITPPADTASAIAAAAIDALSPYTLESYSSRGPTNGPGGSLSGGSVKPDIAAYANVSTASYGARSSGHAFAGTSSACPHIAGAAALVWAANSGWSNTQVRNYLQNNAVDMGSSGKDNDYGYGRLKLAAPSGGGGGGGSTTCTPNATTLCLNGGRFKVQTTWQKPNGQSGSGQAVSLTGDTGYFWFFSSANVEMVLKVLNGCGVNGNYWVYAGGLTNVKVTMTVTDTSNGTVKTYNNPQSTPFQPVQDTGAFHTCP